MVPNHAVYKYMELDNESTPVNIKEEPVVMKSHDENKLMCETLKIFDDIHAQKTPESVCRVACIEIGAKVGNIMKFKSNPEFAHSIRIRCLKLEQTLICNLEKGSIGNGIRNQTTYTLKILHEIINELAFMDGSPGGVTSRDENFPNGDKIISATLGSIINMVDADKNKELKCQNLKKFFEYRLFQTTSKFLS